MDTAAALAAYEAQIRTAPALEQPADRVERGAYTVRYHEPTMTWVLHSDLGAAGDVDAAFAWEVAALRAAGVDAEWKYFTHDRPADLPERLRAAGFEEEGPEALMVAEPADVPRERAPGVEVLEVRTDAELDAMAEVLRTVFGRESAVPRERMKEGIRCGRLVPLLAVIDDVAVSAARLELHQGAEFAGMFGGGTLERYRGRGVYRTLVAHRADLAERKGFPYVYADCLPASEPILARCGFTRLATTIPFTLKG